SAAARMHFEMWVALQPSDGNERRAIPRREAFFGATIASHFPRCANQLRELLVAGAAAQRTPQVGSMRGVEAQVPESISRQAAAIARMAERLRRRGNDAEDRSIRQHVAIRRR